MSFAIDTFPKERLGLVTGSECSVMFPLRGDGVIGMTSYARKLAIQRYFQFYDEFSNKYTDHGDMAEHYAFLHYKDHFDQSVQQGKFYKIGECGGTTDAETPEKIIDFKCPTSLDKWITYLTDKIDKDQYNQLQMYMFLTGKKKAEIAAYLIETQFMTDNGLVYPVPEDKRMIIVTIDRENAWEDRLNEQLPFVTGVRDKYIQKLKQTFG